MIGALAFGYRGFGMTYRPPIGTVLSTAIVKYLLNLVVGYAITLIMDAMATRCGGTHNNARASRVAAYSSTACWVAGFFGLFRPLSVVGFLWLYRLYLIFRGLPVVLTTPPYKARGYTAVVIPAAIVLFLVIGLVAGTFMAGGMG
jgi:hypothetical protein